MDRWAIQRPLAETTANEYWAEGTQWWFWSNYEWMDGDKRLRTPDDLKLYDPKLFELLSRVYIGHHMPADIYYGKNIRRSHGDANPPGGFCMLKTYPLRAAVAGAVVLLPWVSQAQGTAADYQRAMTLRDKYQNLAIGVTDQTRWIQNTNRLWYRKTVKGGYEFVLVDAETKAKGPAFDHARLAASLSTALNRTITPARTAVQSVHVRRRTIERSNSR